jgi:hypothetical protein
MERQDGSMDNTRFAIGRMDGTPPGVCASDLLQLGQHALL